MSNLALDTTMHDKTVSREEAIIAKRMLRKYYQWRFGALPPRGWQADHQVEQNSLCYPRFSGFFVHNITNLIYVPEDINWGKNMWYSRDWGTLPSRYRPARVLVSSSDPTTQAKLQESTLIAASPDLGLAAEPANGTSEQMGIPVRDALYYITQFMEDEEAFVFLTEFSRNMLLRLIRAKMRTSWKTAPPEWLEKHPEWLERLIDEVTNHMHYVAEYRRIERPAPPHRLAVVAAPRDYTQAELQQLWDDPCSFVPIREEGLCPT